MADSFGTSLLVDDGDLVIQGGSLVEVHGLPNLIQGLTLRVFTPFGTDIFSPTYGFDLSAIRLAKPWTFVSPGVSIKPFPSGSLTHPGMTVMLRLIREHNIAADQVERVDVGTNRNMPTALILRRAIRLMP